CAICCNATACAIGCRSGATCAMCIWVADSIDAVLGVTTGIRKTAEPPLEGAARRLTAGQLGAIYTGRMAYGPRALGARSIHANPSRLEQHGPLNKRLACSEFMPFARVTAADKASTVFDIN